MAESGTAAHPKAQQHEFLEMRNVNVARGDRIVLHDVNLSIRTGEHVAVLGPNGCGKSTLILTMTCQIYPMVVPGMHVRIFGRERWDLTQLRKHFGVVATDLPGERTAVGQPRLLWIAGCRRYDPRSRLAAGGPRRHRRYAPSLLSRGLERDR